MRVWVVIDAQQLTFYEYFDQSEQIPKKIKGALYLRDAEIIKSRTEKNQNDFTLKVKTSKGKATFICSDPTSWNTWFNVLNRCVSLHKEIEDREQKPILAREVLGLSSNGKITKSMITRAYKKLTLKEHPDKGGNPDKFHQIYEAYKLLLQLQEEQDDDDNCGKVRYEVIVEKIPGAGLGLSVTEDKIKGKIFVSGLNPKIKIIGITEESNGEVKINDILIGIDEDDCSHWFLSRIRARLDNFRCPIGSHITFTLERRISLQDDEDADENVSNYSSPSSPVRGGFQHHRSRSFYNTGDEEATSKSATFNPSTTTPAEEKEEEKPINPSEVISPHETSSAHINKSMSKSTSTINEPTIVITPPPDEPSIPEKQSFISVDDIEKEDEKEDRSFAKPIVIDEDVDDDMSEESYHYGQGRRTPSPSSFRRNPSNESMGKENIAKKGSFDKEDREPIILTGPPPASVPSEPAFLRSKSSFTVRSKDGKEEILSDGSIYIPTAPTIIINDPEDEEEIVYQSKKLTQKELSFYHESQEKERSQASEEQLLLFESERKLSLLQLELERYQQKEIRILESNEQLNDHISSLLHEKNEFLQLHLDQEKQLYEKELYLRQLSSEQESLKHLINQELPQHINTQNKTYLFNQYQLLQQQYFQYVQYDRLDYERKLQQYRNILYGVKDDNEADKGLDFSQSNPLFHSKVLENMENIYQMREQKASDLEQAIKSLLYS